MTNPPVYPRGYRPRHAADGPDSTPAAARRRADWRPEIQGLRAVAVLLVVVFHIWMGRVSGGVDVTNGFAYIGAWASNVSYAGDPDTNAEVDLYGGIRPSFAG